MPSLVTERIESVKAGIVGAGAFVVGESAFELVKSLFNIIVLQNVIRFSIDWTWSIELGIGAVSGFLFGVTYRYVIRADRNSHLNDGAVLAFGLVRGLALIEKNLILSELLSLSGLVLQSIICFAIARFILDLAIARKLIKPFV